MNEFVKSNAIRYGLIIGAILVGYTLIAYLVDLSLFTVWWVGISLAIIGIVLAIMAVKKTRSEMGGFISFKGAFSTFVFTMIIAAGLSTVFNILIFTVIDPEAAEELQEMTIEKTVDMMEGFNMPEEDLDKQIEKLESNNQYSLGSQLMGFLYGIIFYAVIGLIVAAAMKKDKPYDFIEEESQEI